MTDLIQLQKSLHDLHQVYASESMPGSEAIAMDAARFFEYATEQLEKVKAEPRPAAADRLAHLLKSVDALVKLGKNAFDSDGAMIPMYQGELSIMNTSAYSEKRADHTQKMGTGISFESANTEAMPASNAFGRGGPQLGQNQFTFHGMVGKSAITAFAKAVDPDFRQELLSALSDTSWPRNLNADGIDTDPSLQF